MKLTAIAMVMAALGLAGCGGSSSRDQATTAAATAAGADRGGAASSKTPSKFPPGAVVPVDTTEAAEGQAATEASPEAPANGPRSTGSLPGPDSAAVTAVVRLYIAALDRRDAGRICALIAPGGLPLGDLPKPRGACRPSLRASIGTRPADGGPAWRSTEIVELKPEALGGDRARVTATVTHHFSDRKYVSVEDDVIYLERAGARWLLAKPSATLYRAVGYAQPPLRAFSPPADW
jgi:hypothetical protein